MTLYRTLSVGYIDPQHTSHAMPSLAVSGLPSLPFSCPSLLLSSYLKHTAHVRTVLSRN